MTEKEKLEFLAAVPGSTTLQLFKFARDKGYDYDTIVGIICADVIDISLNFKLKLYDYV